MTTAWRENITTPVGVCVMPPPGLNASRTTGYPEYIFEILDAAGLFYTREPIETLAEHLPKIGVLVTVGEGTPDAALQNALRNWVKAGGSWIAVAGTCELHDVLGVAPAPRGFSMFGAGQSNLGEGYLKPEGAHIITAHLEIPLHYYNGIPLLSAGSSTLATALDAHARAKECVIVSENSHGEGLALAIAADITGSVVAIQQGRGAVTRDGFPAPDSSAPVCDIVLKSGDAGALDWLLDREPVPGVEGFSAYLQPIADQWRELLLRAIFYAADKRNIPVPVLWLYPRNQSAIGHISLDTDGNDPDQAEILFQTLQEQEVRATWCTIMPGLPAEFMEKIHTAGHELAMHYDAMTEGLNWGRDQFSSQWRSLVNLFGGRPPVTNKNHYLRWEGDSDIWDWCIDHQIQLDQSKGASKTGEAGFNFGTCRPYFPVTFRGQKLDVLELPTYTQDLEIFAPTALYYALIRPVQKHHGVLHLLFHPAHTHKPATNKALREVTAHWKSLGLEWWTAAEINAWERARRSITWESYRLQSDGTAGIAASASTPLHDATLLMITGPGSPGDTSRRWGFSSQIINITISTETNKEN